MQGLNEIEQIEVSPQNRRNDIVKLGKATRFKPGQAAANPSGRPKTALFRDTCLKWLAANPQRRIKIIERLALTKPDFIVQLVDGKLADTVSLQNGDGSNLMSQDLIQAAVAAAALRSGN